MLSGLILTQTPDIPEQWLIRSLSEFYSLTVALNNEFDCPTAEVIKLRVESKLNFLPPKNLRRKFNFCLCFDSRTIPMGLCLKILGFVKRLIVYRGTTGGVGFLDPTSWVTFRNPLVDKIVANCEAVSKSLIKSGISSNKVVTIYKGHKPEWYTSYDQVGDDKILSTEFVTVMNYRRSKGLERTIRFICDNFPTATLSVFGYVPPKVMSKCGPNINWYGYVDRPFRFFDRFKFFILLSSKEGIPKACVEASFNKLPLIVTNCGGIEEIWDDSSAVIIRDLTDSVATDEAVKKINLILSDKSERDKYVSNALKAVTEKLDFSQTVKMYRQLIDTV